MSFAHAGIEELGALLGKLCGQHALYLVNVY